MKLKLKPKTELKGTFVKKGGDGKSYSMRI